MDRRTFMKGAAAGLGAAAIAAPNAGAADFVNLALPSLGLQKRRGRTPVQHIVVVMMENRSVDHYLGWYGAENPAFDATQDFAVPDLRVPGAPLVHTEDWGANGRANYHGRGFADPSHGWTGGRIERNGGALDGFLHPDTGNDEFTMSTYEAQDVPVWSQLTRGWQAYDRWFCSLLGPTQPNRYYQYSGTSSGIKDNSLPPEFMSTNPEWAVGWNWPTVWDLCQAGGISSAYYFSNLPETAFWGPRLLHHTHHVAEFFAACTLGTLPQVSIIDPWYTGPGGLANDDHPHADIRLGQQFLSDIVEAFTHSPYYRQGALLLTYDEWGGFWDHVDPPRVDDERATHSDPGGDEDFAQLGFRIPSTIVSPWTRNGASGRVDHTVYEHTSVLKFISENWGLPYLTKRCQSTNSIEHAFDGFRTFDARVDFEPYRLGLLERLDLILDPTLEGLSHGELPRAIPGVPAPQLPIPAESQSDLHRLAEIGWFDDLKVNIDHRFEDGFLRPSVIRDLLRTAGV